jgi:HlyD family secretion protein
MKKLILIVVVLAALGGGFYYYKVRTATPEPTVMTQPVSRGDIVETVGATGTLEAVKTVNVGTQVSGVVQELYADFNSIVKRGQVIAKLDPQLIQTQIEQQNANVVRAEADLERLKVSLADAEQKLERARQMSAKELIPKTELETAEVNVQAAKAQLRSSEAGLTQARAQLNNQKVNLGYTTITAPIDGIVIQRSVDQGQTVAASMNAPTLYIIAADLTQMQVLANIDEADVGRMRPGQHVTFRVDAFPTDVFTGTVSQVRLQPAVVQNVVTYSTVISVPNPELKLKPGMTANVNIEINRRTNVLRVPNAATRFRPTPEMFTVLNQPVPPELERGRGGFAGRGRGDGARGQGGTDRPGGAAPSGAPAPTAAQPQAQQQTPPAAAQPGGGQRARADQPAAGQQAAANAGRQGSGGGRGEGRGGFNPNMTPEEREERRKRMEERLAGMSPEEREAFQARMRDGGGRGGFGGRQGGGRDMGASASQNPTNGNGGSRGGRQANAPSQGGTASRTMASGATTIDSLFGPLPVSETRGTVWQYENKQLKPIRLRLGITDQNFTEVLNDSDVPPNAELVVTMTTGLETRTQPGQNQQNNPLMGPQRGGPGGRGGGGGGGGRGGRG